MADEHEPLGALTGEERSAIASQFSVLAKASTALAKLFDPSVKAKVGRPPKEKVGKSGEPKAKREPTAYNNFMAAHLKPYKAEHPELTQNEVMTAVAAQWKHAPENPKARACVCSKVAARADARRAQRQGAPLAIEAPQGGEAEAKPKKHKHKHRDAEEGEGKEKKKKKREAQEA